MLSKNETKILKLIKYAPVTIVVCLSIIATYLFLLDKEIEHQENITKIQKSFIQKNKQKIKDEVNRVHDYILYEKTNSEKLLKIRIKNRVDEAYRIIDSIYKKYKNIQSEEEIIIRIKDALRQYRFNENRGYFYIYKLNGTNVLHSLKPHLEGKNLISFKDVRGIKVVKETIDSLRFIDGSYNEIYWNKPNDLRHEYKKITYNRTFKPYRWFIGTGEYVNEFENEIKNKIVRYISSTKYSKNGYVFIVDYNGKYLAHVKKEYIGLNRINLQDKNGVLITREIINTAKDGEGFIKYIGTIKPETKLPASKTTFIKGLKDWDWAIATGFYTDELENEIKKVEAQVREKNKHSIFTLLTVSAIVTILFLSLSLYLSSVLRYRFLKHRKEVINQINKNRQKDSMLAQQSKMAAMGEMIQNIAHQWRQPLNSISTISTGIKFQKEFNTLNDEDLINAMDSINNSSKYLSQTIEDFREFFDPDRKVTRFNIKNTFEKTFKLLETQFNEKGIEIIKDIEPFDVYGYENELIQVLINLLNNARDEFDKKEFENKVIFVEVKSNNKDAIIRIKDNAGGIAEEIIDRVFEPYFTTKHKSQGTGIGLYMTREIIVKHMRGLIQVYNKDIVYKNKEFKGALFEITFNLKKLK